MLFHVLWSLTKRQCTPCAINKVAHFLHTSRTPSLFLPQVDQEWDQILHPSKDLRSPFLFGRILSRFCSQEANQNYPLSPKKEMSTSDIWANLKLSQDLTSCSTWSCCCCCCCCHCRLNLDDFAHPPVRVRSNQLLHEQQTAFERYVEQVEHLLSSSLECYRLYLETL